MTIEREPRSHARLADEAAVLNRVGGLIAKLAGPGSAPHDRNSQEYSGYIAGIRAAYDLIEAERLNAYTNAGVTNQITAREATLTTHDGIRRAARQLGAHHNIYDQDGLADIYRLVTELGGTIVRDDGPWDLEIADAGEFVIHIGTLQNARRVRFQAARAIAHFYLHYLQVGGQLERVAALFDPSEMWTGRLMLRRGIVGAANTDANVFAAALLMPVEQFTAAWEELDGREDNVGDRFQVSPLSAKIMAEVLGLPMDLAA